MLDLNKTIQRERDHPLFGPFGDADLPAISLLGPPVGSYLAHTSHLLPSLGVGPSVITIDISKKVDPGSKISDVGQIYTIATSPPTSSSSKMTSHKWAILWPLEDSKHLRILPSSL